MARRSEGFDPGRFDRDGRPWLGLCLECGIGRTFPALTWRRRVGNMPLDLVQSRLTCKGCGERRGILMPPDANWLAWDPPPPTDRMPFNIEVWDLAGLHVEEVVGRASELLVARATYRAVVQARPGRMVTLRQGVALLNSTVMEGSTVLSRKADP